MATNHNFRVKNGLEVGGVEIVDSSGVLQLASTLTSTTQSSGTNNTTLATTAFVTAAITAIGNGKIDWTVDQGSTNIHAGNYINTTYSVGDGGLTTNDFTNADHSKLNAIEASATADQTDAEIRAAVEAATDSNVFTDADHSKLNAIEASATADQTNAEIRTAVEAATDSNVFTDADHSKLNAIEASATADQTGAQIKALYEAESNAYTDALNTKLAGIETSATADQTNAEIRTAVEAATDSNVFTDADHSKLNAIEASADVTDTTNVVASLSAGTGVAISGGGEISVTAVALTTVQTAANQTAHLALTAQEGDIVVRSDENKTYCHNGGSAGTMNDYTLLATPTDAVLSVAGNTGAVSAAQIATAVEAASNSNTFTDADHSKLNAIEASADVTDATNVTAAGALMDSELTSIAAVKALNQAVGTADGPTFASGNITNGLTVGGEIAANGGIALADNDKATFGTGDDLQIYHDGNHSWIRDLGTGDLILQGTQLRIRAGNNENHIYCTEDGAVQVYYNGVEKLATTSTGIDVTGTVTIPDYVIHDGNTATKFGFGSANTMNFISNGSDRLTIANSYAVFNEGGTDYDFRVESDGNANMLFVDGGNNRVGVGTGSPSEPFHVQEGSSGITSKAGTIALIDGSGNSKLTIASGATSTGELLFGRSTDNDAGRIIYDHNNNSLSSYTNGTEALSIDSSQNVSIPNGTITSAGKDVGTQTVTATAPTSATGFPNGHVWYVV